MDDNEFYDGLYQQWTKTTGAEISYWMPEENPDRSGRWNVYAVEQEGSRKLVASGMTEKDSEWLAGIHGALPELIRSLHDATAEAERMDEARDRAEANAGEALLENLHLRSELHDLEIEYANLEARAKAKEAGIR